MTSLVAPSRRDGCEGAGNGSHGICRVIDSRWRLIGVVRRHHSGNWGRGQSRHVARFQKLRARQTSANLFGPAPGTEFPEGQGVHAELKSRSSECRKDTQPHARPDPTLVLARTGTTRKN
jgi:hypothetical protein